MKQENGRKPALGIVMLTVCSIIWGTAFVAQSLGGKYAEPLTFNFSRCVLATIFIFILCFVKDKLEGKKFTILGSDDPMYCERLLKGGFICGATLTMESFFQQLGLMYTTVGKSGFITSLYIVLVPILSFIIFRKAISKLQAISVIVAAIGMYFICINEAFTINMGDVYTFLCAVCFAGQIISVANIISYLDGVRLSLIQFATSAVLNCILMFTFENPSLDALLMGWAPIAYAGIMSSGIAYTLQIVGQKHVNAVPASMIMSMEAVFALLSGWLILGQEMTTREIGGCVLVFSAIILAQIPPKYLGIKE